MHDSNVIKNLEEACIKQTLEKKFQDFKKCFKISEEKKEAQLSFGMILKWKIFTLFNYFLASD